MMISRLTLLLGINAAISAFANPLQPASSPSHASNYNPSGNWMRFSLALEPDDPLLLGRTLREISDPTSPRYGQHLSRDDAHMLRRPKEETVLAVRRWLADSEFDVSEMQQDRRWIHFHSTESKARNVLLPVRDLPDDGNRVRRLSKRSLPLEIRNHISYIQYGPVLLNSPPRGDRLFAAARIKETQSLHKRCESRPKVGHDTHLQSIKPATCQIETTPACLRELYRIKNPSDHPHAKSSLGVVGFNGQAAQYAELERFLELFASDAAGSNFSVELVNGGENPQGDYPSGEANLDIQYAVALAHTVPVRYYAVGGQNHDFMPDLDIADPELASVEPYLQLAQYLVDLGDDDLPSVLSISYGINEQVLSESYTREVCELFGQLGTRGVSVIVASGDTGPGISCQSNDGNNRTTFLPIFPASCPYVTAVGATENSPEMAAEFSSGGFSEHFRRPDWQDEAIEEWRKDNGDDWTGFYNPEGRAYPDVSAIGKNFQIVNHDEVASTSGTSASAPVFGAMIALINNNRFHQGKPALGFLNPWVYRIGDKAFKDIVNGKSRGCEGTSLWGLPSPKVDNAGWEAARGWDPVTGWGTPLYGRLKKAAGC